MNQGPVVSYKIYLCAAGYEPEIRRITIDKDISHNYFFLKQKLISIFPALKDVQFTISWKDREGDTVRICTDEELIIALREMDNQDFKKIFVSTSPKQGGEGPLHPNVVCDGCEGVVQGFRYKCIVCSDFDLCGDCERSQVHPDHPMLRIPLPLSPDMPFSRRFGRDLHKMSKHLEYLLHHSDRFWSDKKGRGDCPRQGGDKRQRGCPFSSNMDPFKDLFNIVTNNPYFRAYQPDRPSAEGTEAAPDSSNQESASQPQPQQPSPPNLEEQKKFVEIIRQGLTSLLDPLGAEVVWSSEGSFCSEGTARGSAVSHNSPPQPDSASSSVSQSQSATTPVPDLAKPSQAPSEVEQKPTNVQPQTVNITLNQRGGGGDSSMENLAAGDAVREVRFVLVPETKSEKEDSPVLDHTWTVIQNQSGEQAAPEYSPPTQVAPEYSPPTQAAPEYSPPTQAAPEYRPPTQAAAEFIPPTQAAAEFIPPTQTQETTLGQTPSLYPIINDRPVEPPVTDSVEETMNRMAAMGFVDEEGWLRQLVENKKGNIHEVLKFLSPIPKPPSSQ